MKNIQCARTKKCIQYISTRYVYIRVSISSAAGRLTQKCYAKTDVTICHWDIRILCKKQNRVSLDDHDHQRQNVLLYYLSRSNPSWLFFLLHQLFKLYSICFVLACKMPYGTLKITSSLLVCTYIYMLVWSSEVPSFASPDDVTLGQSGPFYLEFNEVLDICVITCYIIIMQQYLLKSEDFND